MDKSGFISRISRKILCIGLFLFLLTLNVAAQSGILSSAPWKVVKAESRYDSDPYKEMSAADSDPCLRNGVYHFISTGVLLVKLDKNFCRGIAELKGTWKLSGAGATAKLILILKDDEGNNQETVFGIQLVSKEKLVLVQSYEDEIGLMSERTTFIPVVQDSGATVQPKQPTVHKAVFASELYEFIQTLNTENCREKLKKWGYTFNQVYGGDQWIFEKGKEGYLNLGIDPANKKRFAWITYVPLSGTKLPVKHFNEFNNDKSFYVISQNEAGPESGVSDASNSFYYKGLLFRAELRENACREFSVHKMTSEWHYKKLKENYPGESFPELEAYFDSKAKKPEPVSTKDKDEAFCNELKRILELANRRDVSELTAKEEGLNYNTTYKVVFPLRGFEKMQLTYYITQFVILAEWSGTGVTNKADEAVKEQKFHALEKILDDCLSHDYRKFVTNDKKTYIYENRLNSKMSISIKRDPIDYLENNIQLKISYAK